MSRAAATGGSRSYRGKTPVNWYAALAIIVVLGVLSVGFARYEYTHPSSSKNKTTTWYAGISFVRCGTAEPVLPASSAGAGVSTPGSGVLAISVKDKSQATLSRFVDHYPGLVLTANKLRYPGSAALSNGDRCPAGTPDAGKKGRVQVVSWSNFSQKTGKTATGDPGSLHLTNGQLITAAFVPAGSTIPKPPQSTITAVLSAIGGSPPTTTAPSTTTTAPAGSTTTAPAGSTTTAPAGSTTTAPAGSTTTAKK